MIFHLTVAGLDPFGAKFSMGIGECDYQTDGQWDPYKIGKGILWRINVEREHSIHAVGKIIEPRLLTT